MKLGRILCVVGLHTGQRDGGTLMYTCPRCTKFRWQTRDYSAVTRRGDALIDEGRGDEALHYAQDKVRRGDTSS